MAIPVKVLYYGNLCFFADMLNKVLATARDYHIDIFRHRYKFTHGFPISTIKHLNDMSI